MKTNINSKLYMLFALCIVCTGIAINNMYTVLAPDSKVVAEKSIVAGYDDSNSQVEWWPEIKTTKTVKKVVPIMHKVVSGDCVYNLGKQYKATVKEITGWNKLRNANIVRVGQELVVGYEEKEFEEAIIEEEFINMEIEPKHVAEINLAPLTLDYLNPSNLFTPFEKERFPYVAEYVRNNDRKGDHQDNLSSRKIFTKSEDLSFFEKADMLGIKYNKPGDYEYNLYEIAESTIGKFVYVMAGNLKFAKAKQKLIADCSKYTQILEQAWTGEKVAKRTTSTLFRNSKKFDKNSIVPGIKVGWKAFANKNGKYIHGHVYMYVGNGKFANLSSSRNGVFITTLEKIERLSKIYNMKMTV